MQSSDFVPGETYKPYDGPSNVTHRIYCNTDYVQPVGAMLHCGSVDKCIYYCNATGCIHGGILNARVADNLFVIAQTNANECFMSNGGTRAEVRLGYKYWRNSTFLTEGSPTKAFKGLKLRASDDPSRPGTGDIEFIIGSEVTASAKTLTDILFAPDVSLAGSLSITIHGTARIEDSDITCPTYSLDGNNTYQGSLEAPCVIDLGPSGSFADTNTIRVPNGSPAGVVFPSGTSGGESTTIICDEGNNTITDTTGICMDNTKYPTAHPSMTPSTPPSEPPTSSPSYNPSTSPSLSPSRNPTFNPSDTPTSPPSDDPSIATTGEPSRAPTKEPVTAEPSGDPTSVTSTNPSQIPTNNPTFNPMTRKPSEAPTSQPTSPTHIPTANTSPPSQRPNFVVVVDSDAPSINDKVNVETTPSLFESDEIVQRDQNASTISNTVSIGILSALLCLCAIGYIVVWRYIKIREKNQPLTPGKHEMAKSMSYEDIQNDKQSHAQDVNNARLPDTPPAEGISDDEDSNDEMYDEHGTRGMDAVAEILDLPDEDSDKIHGVMQIRQTDGEDLNKRNVSKHMEDSDEMYDEYLDGNTIGQDLEIAPLQDKM